MAGPSTTVDAVSEISGNDPIEDVAAGDIIAVDRGYGERSYKVVFKDSTDDGYVVTLEDDDGETFQIDLAANAVVKRSLGSKWESAQSPTPHLEN
jgi:hypothetical protein